MAKAEYKFSAIPIPEPLFYAVRHMTKIILPAECFVNFLEFWNKLSHA
jgi:hypothetical protein